jgi:hypothetical protein
MCIRDSRRAQGNGAGALAAGTKTPVETKS